MKKITCLRNKVKKIDCKIIKLVQRRFDITRNIGKEKKKLGIPLQDWSVERDVIDNALDMAKRVGLNYDLVKTLITKIIEQSRLQQEKLHYSTYSGNREDILIVGGLGAMGHWFANFFQNQGHSVSICDIQPKGINGFKYYRNLKYALKGKTFLLISTPLSTVPRIINMATNFGYKGVVCDIASIKGHIVSSIKRAVRNGVKITSIHPMFGPSCQTLTDKVICLCDCGVPYANQMVLNFFKNTAVKIVSLSFEEHDQIICYVLGLSHLINILFIKTLINSGYDYADLKSIASTTFNSQLTTTFSVIHENPELYYEIQVLNPYNSKLFRNLKVNLEGLIAMIEGGKRDIFKEVFNKGRQWLDGH
ncbi:MAG: prephenate dehydrogenase/arogenate dehydrogenase family protein [candidate division WOR-3 bacterium]